MDTARISCRVLALALVLSVLPGPVIADRHCAPVMEAYWRARTFLMQEGQTCADALGQSIPDFHEAVAQARICGYTALHDRLNSLLFDADEGGSCEARVKRILEFSPELQEIIEDYHY